MKTKFYSGIITLILAITFIACGGGGGGGGGNSRFVSVGVQSGEIAATHAGSVTYFVTTNGIADGEYTVIVDNLPIDVSIGNNSKVTVTNNIGLLTLIGGTITSEGV